MTRLDHLCKYNIYVAIEHDWDVDSAWHCCNVEKSGSRADQADHAAEMCAMFAIMGVVGIVRVCGSCALVCPGATNGRRRSITRGIPANQAAKHMLAKPATDTKRSKLANISYHCGLASQAAYRYVGKTKVNTSCPEHQHSCYIQASTTSL